MSENNATAKLNKITLARRILQVLGIFAIGQWAWYGLLRCPFPVPFVSCLNCPVIPCWGRIGYIFWSFWFLLPVSVLIFGRAFCSWFCPGGLFNQILGKLALIKLRVRQRIVSLLFYISLISLMLALVLWLYFDNPRIMVPIRTGEVFRSIILSFEHASPLWLIRTIFVIVLLLSSVIIANLWCRFVCPTGGMLEIFKKFSLFKIVKTDACNDCNKCLKICEMGTRPDEKNCTNCGDCLNSCPMKAIKVKRRI